MTSLITAPSLWALVPMILFLVLTLRGKNYTLSVGIAAILGCILMGQGPAEFAGILVDNLGGTLGQVGLIIMFGSGLGLVMDAAGINEVIVNFVVKKIGVNSERKGMFACYLVSLIMVVLIGTLNGGNAVVAPIILPIVAAAGLTPTTVCFLMFNAGLVGVTIGPFCSAVAAALGVSGLSYQDYMLYSAIPYSLVWSLVSFVIAIRIQKKTKTQGEKYEAVEIPAQFHATARQRNACIGFLTAFIVCLIYGLIAGSTMKYVMFVILFLSAVVGCFIKQPYDKTIALFGRGMGKMGGMFLSFLLTGVMIDTISLGGGWEALSGLILHIIGSNGKYLLMVIASFVGGFGVEGAVVTQMQIIQSAFWDIASNMGIPMTAWSIVLIAAVRITSIVYPSANYAAHLGFARSENMKTLLVAGWITAAIMMAFVPVWGFVVMNFLS
ncbi:hypothetical protein V3C10_15875 [[Clostridium] symbiosum]|uniref:GntT/GntP/DsdX family permease n=1 Tax=Clostridium symbiosum TaxID=1512 RepID=UPI001D088982|nr:hypothetical protein [[Clostridium] symbiosum]MCB6610103.1 hypothetical protein [[Clostridium] symbiosum]MCB6930525.1 hypothetical protein [[Clostridium] symbiosum]